MRVTNAAYPAISSFDSHLHLSFVDHVHRFDCLKRWKSRLCSGRPKISEEIRTVVRTMAAENLDWGAPKIHGELLKLRRRGDPGKRWLAFLANHHETIVAIDFFTVPTLTFNRLYCFFMIEHGRRGILHFNVTNNLTSDWVVQQLRGIFSDAPANALASLSATTRKNVG